MKALICVLSLWAAIAWGTDFDFSTVVPHVVESRFDMSTMVPDEVAEHETSGFGGYGFGSSRDFVRFERGLDGHVKDDETGEWIWYSGKFEGCGLRSGYQFSGRDKLIGGIWVINNSDECFKRIEANLDEYYGDQCANIEIRRSKIVSERWIPHTRIVHRKSSEYHSVTFSDTFDESHIGGRDGCR